VPRKKRTRRTVATHAELLRLRRELRHLRTLANATAMLLDATARDGVANLRRCAELQTEIDTLKKLFNPSA
jgi:hypothetical protein